ncbi:hypothetical protein N0B31_09560 [Salinirubellus salinus]|uniref:HTH iclR-type domain-containing protein n=1 Tax=Salinirubellus salinus TaxID=1364945 RepID=A0A9E7UA10_9EURY|nr:hypothetical protein [Salinirubellus salinus]UWM56521.1 hypothetical protein N0B31_09560 [Salinirubellus salinus]
MALSLALASLLVVGVGAPLLTLGAPTVAAGAPAAGTQPATADRPGPESVAEAQQEFDRTAFLVTVYGNGTARWTFRFERTLSNETERQDFETFADRFDSEETALYTDFVNRSERLVSAGTNATDREMAAEAFQRDARVSELGNEGIVEMSFRWVGFATVEGDRVVVGDVFEGGLYIRADQRLVFTRGPGVVFEEASPSPESIAGESLAESDSVTWRGERTFADERPRVVLAQPSASTGTATATTSPGTGGGPADTATTPGAGGGGGGLGMLPLVGLLAVLLLGVGGAVAYRSGALGGGDAGAASATITGDDGDGDGGAAAAAAGAAGEADPEPEPAVTDAELLSDEERVMRLLDENGGRMKQVNIVDETDWSKSKVSMLLSEMEEAGEISKLRVGRENIISKKGMEPDAARSPFEDEDA